MTHSTTSGFIALMSAILISAVLLLVVTTGSLTGFYQRFNILDTEFKGRSAAAADACADQAFLLVANNPAYVGLTLLDINALDSCRALVGDDSPDKSIRIQATSSSAVTNLQIIYNPNTLSVVSWQEIPVF